MVFLLLGSAFAAAAASLTLSPYTDHAPQKIMLNQVHQAHAQPQLAVCASFRLFSRPARTRLQCCTPTLATPPRVSVRVGVERTTCRAHHVPSFRFEQVHSHGPGATSIDSFGGIGAANGTSSAGFDAGADAVMRSVWAVTAFDSGPVRRALPNLGLQPAKSQPRDMQVCPGSASWSSRLGLIA